MLARWLGCRAPRRGGRWAERTYASRGSCTTHTTHWIDRCALSRCAFRALFVPSDRNRQPRWGCYLGGSGSGAQIMQFSGRMAEERSRCSFGQTSRAASMAAMATRRARQLVTATTSAPCVGGARLGGAAAMRVDRCGSAARAVAMIAAAVVAAARVAGGGAAGGGREGPGRNPLSRIDPNTVGG